MLLCIVKDGIMEGFGLINNEDNCHQSCGYEYNGLERFDTGDEII